MVLQLRQICIVTRDLDDTLAQLTAVFGLKQVFTDPEVAQFGARNAICPIGTDFIELISPLHTDAHTHKFLDAMQGDAGYMVITQAGSKATQQLIRDRAGELNVRAVFEATVRGADYLQWHPADTGGSLLETSFDHLGELEGHWDAAGGYANATADNTNRLKILKVGIASADPLTVARRWGQLTFSPVSSDDAGNPQIKLNNAKIEFTPIDIKSTRAGLNRVYLSCASPEPIIKRAKIIGHYCPQGNIRIAGVDFFVEPEDKSGRSQ